VVLAQRAHLDAATNRSRNLSRVALDVVDNLTACCKAIRVGAGKTAIRQAHRPVRKLESQPVPALASPTFGDATALDHQMRRRAAADHIAHGEPCLTAPDDQGFSRLRHPPLPPPAPPVCSTTAVWADRAASH